MLTNEERKRPDLSIITDNISSTSLNSTPKKSWKRLFGNSKVTTSPTSTMSAESSPAKSFTPISARKSINSISSTETVTSIKSQSSHKRVSSLDVNINNNVGILKKFQTSYSLKKKEVEIKSAVDTFEPIAPEPIVPSIILDWAPNVPISPLPWELSDQDKRKSTPVSVQENNNIVYDPPINLSSCDFKVESDRVNISPTDSHSSQDTLTDSKEFISLPKPAPPVAYLRRRSSCPNIHRLASVRTSTSSVSSDSTLIDKDIISITEEHTRDTPLLKKARPKSVTFTAKPCQKAKARAAEAAEQGEKFQINNPIFSTLCEEQMKYSYIANVFDPNTHKPVLKFTSIKPRKYQLYRKTNWKKEAKALLEWHDKLENQLVQPTQIACLPNDLSADKLAKNAVTRKYIIKEFFTTEVNFWNQLYYTKLIFYDALAFAIKNKPKISKFGRTDIFANLFELMQFSAKLINYMRHVQVHYVDGKATKTSPCERVGCNGINIGKILCSMAEDFVVFLRCAVDYRENRKLYEAGETNPGFNQYKQRLYSKKETSQFTLEDYLIIPIQRVARYGLLLADLIRHTSSDNPDYEDLVKAYNIITSLGTAMNLAQKKSKMK